MPVVGVVVDFAREEGLELRLEAADEGVEVVGGFADGKVGDYGLEFGGIGRDGGGLLDGVKVLACLVLGEGDAEGMDHGRVEGGEGGEAAGEGQGGVNRRSAACLPPQGSAAGEEEGADVVDAGGGGCGEGGAEVEPGLGGVQPSEDLGRRLAVELGEGGDRRARGKTVDLDGLGSGRRGGRRSLGLGGGL